MDNLNDEGSIYSRRVKEGGATLPAAIGRQLSDQGEYPLGLLCCGQDSGPRGAPIFVHAGEIVHLLSVCPQICRRSTWRSVNGDGVVLYVKRSIFGATLTPSRSFWIYLLM
ncbi:hypothetical protein Hanom_Chr02g00172271 [Helianthus anomalus]